MTKVNKKNQIVIPYGMKKEIAKELKVCEATVYLALRGKVSGKKSIECREIAREKLKNID